MSKGSVHLFPWVTMTPPQATSTGSLTASSLLPLFLRGSPQLSSRPVSSRWRSLLVVVVIEPLSSALYFHIRLRSNTQTCNLRHQRFHSCHKPSWLPMNSNRQREPNCYPVWAAEDPWSKTHFSSASKEMSPNIFKRDLLPLSKFQVVPGNWICRPPYCHHSPSLPTLPGPQCFLPSPCWSRRWAQVRVQVCVAHTWFGPYHSQPVTSPNLSFFIYKQRS